eukprot:6641949-Ditylum_brightwellii.AAC.1
MGVHQCARFTNQPMMSHERAFRRIVKYLSTMTDRGIVYDPNPNLGMQCFFNADFAGSWSNADADNPESVMSCTEIALSTTEVEYIALSSAMREVIPFMNLLEELSQ